jgi:hypothetical protein
VSAGKHGVKIWHPILDEMEADNSQVKMDQKYQEIETNAKVESLVPLSFTSDLQFRK